MQLIAGQLDHVEWAGCCLWDMIQPSFSFIVGVALPFEITEFDDGHAWAWKVAGVPATRHSVRPWVGGCRVTFGVPIWAPVYLTVCAVGLKRIEAIITAADVE